VRRIVSIDFAVHPRVRQVCHALGLARYDRHVWSSRRGAHRAARRRLAPFPHVTLVVGDARRWLPSIVARLAAEPARVGVLIDGPKEAEQLRLAERLLGVSPHVVFAALDDIGPMFDDEGRHARFVDSPFAAFATSDREFFDRYGWINAGRLPERMIGRPDHTGYGLGVLINR
jgi:hypothetical protein